MSRPNLPSNRTSGRHGNWSSGASRATTTLSRSVLSTIGGRIERKCPKPKVVRAVSEAECCPITAKERRSQTTPSSQDENPKWSTMRPEVAWALSQLDLLPDPILPNSMAKAMYDFKKLEARLLELDRYMDVAAQSMNTHMDRIEKASDDVYSCLAFNKRWYSDGRRRREWRTRLEHLGLTHEQMSKEYRGLEADRTSLRWDLSVAGEAIVKELATWKQEIPSVPQALISPLPNEYSPPFDPALLETTEQECKSQEELDEEEMDFVHDMSLQALDEDVPKGELIRGCLDEIHEARAEMFAHQEVMEGLESGDDTLDLEFAGGMGRRQFIAYANGLAEDSKIRLKEVAVRADLLGMQVSLSGEIIYNPYPDLEDGYSGGLTHVGTSLYQEEVGPYGREMGTYEREMEDEAETKREEETMRKEAEELLNQSLEKVGKWSASITESEWRSLPPVEPAYANVSAAELSGDQLILENCLRGGRNRRFEMVDLQACSVDEEQSGDRDLGYCFNRKQIDDWRAKCDKEARKLPEALRRRDKARSRERGSQRRRERRRAMSV